MQCQCRWPQAISGSIILRTVQSVASGEFVNTMLEQRVPSKYYLYNSNEAIT